jgi:hypothetical protein
MLHLAEYAANFSSEVISETYCFLDSGSEVEKRFKLDVIQPAVTGT